VKLALPETESAALEAAVRGTSLVTSEVVEVEVRRAVRRGRPGAERAVDLPLSGVSLIPLDDRIRRLAGTLGPSSLRTLDAIHLATALAVGELDELIAYDRRLVDAARAQGLAVLSPS
jgi:predicted nucleic acid-binding protein